MLTNKQRSQLRSMAHHLQPIVHIGKLGVNDNLVQSTLNALHARELIKISILQNCMEDPKEVAQIISNLTNSHLVQTIGRIIILYKKSPTMSNRKVSKLV